MSTAPLARDWEGEPRVHAAMVANGWPDWAQLPQVYSGAGFHVFVGREHCGGKPEDPKRWHISVNGPGRTPTWEEIVSIAHELRPGVPFVIGIPPRSQWLNLHPHVLHLWQIDDPALLEEWRVNATGQEPT